MKLCPKCKSNVEGLIHHCDCCGAVLDAKTRLITCGVYDLPACLDFGELSFKMIDEIEPKDISRYDIKEILFKIVCWPKSLLESLNVKEGVYFSPQKKKSRVSVLVDYEIFIHSNKKSKELLVATAIHRGIYLLSNKLNKQKINIDDILISADIMLKKYSKDTGDGVLCVDK